MNKIATELSEINDILEKAKKDAQKFDDGNDAAGTRVRKAAQEAKSRLQGLRNMVTEMREERFTNRIGQGLGE